MPKDGWVKKIPSVSPDFVAEDALHLFGTYGQYARRRDFEPDETTEEKRARARITAAQEKHGLDYIDTTKPPPKPKRVKTGYLDPRNEI